MKHEKISSSETEKCLDRFDRLRNGNGENGNGFGNGNGRLGPFAFPKGNENVFEKNIQCKLSNCPLPLKKLKVNKSGKMIKRISNFKIIGKKK